MLRALKICDLTQFYSPVSGGVKRYVSEKVRYLRRQAADDEHLLIIPGERDAVEEGERSKVYTIASPLISRAAQYRMLWRLGEVERVLEKERPDLIESGDPYQVGWRAAKVGASLGIPTVGFYHSHFSEAYLRTLQKFLGRTATDFLMEAARRYVRRLYNRFARTLVPSPALGEVLTSWGVENVAVTNLGVDTEVFRADVDDAPATRAGLGLAPETKLLLYVGRLAPEKNTRTLCAAFECLGRGFHLAIVGDGNERWPVERIAGREDVTWIRYCGDSARLAQLYRAADLFVHPGVQETFGLVTLEAQACGTPVIGIHGSYMDRIIHTAQTGWARENTPEALARAIEAAPLPAPEERRALAREIAGRYAWETVFARLFDLYREVIEHHRSPSP